MIRRKGAAESYQSDSTLLSRLHCFSLVIISPRGLMLTSIQSPTMFVHANHSKRVWQERKC